MAKQKSKLEINAFVKGYLTEASPLNFPPDALSEGFNFELNRRGTVDRRLGIDFESSYALIPTSVSTINYESSKFNCYKWTGVNGSVTQDFIVVQIDNLLKFFDGNKENPSANEIGEISLSSFDSNVSFSFTDISGKLVVVSGKDFIAVVSYDGSAFSVEYQRIKIRDVWGVEESISAYETDPSYRDNVNPNDTHWYNLQNQSWGIPRKNSSGSLMDPIVDYFNDLGKYPSNTEHVWTALQFSSASSTFPHERQFNQLFDDLRGSQTTTSKGYFIIDAFRRGQSRSDEFIANKNKYPELSTTSVTLPLDYSTKGPTIVTEFAGRTWYSGCEGEVVDGDSRSPDFTNYVFFSTLVKASSDINKCYQEGDPTSRESNEIVDTDGGFIRVSGAKKIIALVPMFGKLIVIADSGVWVISGGSDYGFSATNLKVEKISDFGGYSRNSVVIEGDKTLFWSSLGIFVVTKNQYNDIVIHNISEKTIQSYYDSLTEYEKVNAVGVYDPINKKIRWLINSGEYFNSSASVRELILDTAIGAFYKFDIKNIGDNSVAVVGVVAGSNVIVGVSEDTVYSDSDLVYSDVDLVVSNSNVRATNASTLKYLTLKNVSGVINITFSDYHDAAFRDWKTVDGVGVDAFAYGIVGVTRGGDGSVHKQVPYVTMYFYRTEEGVDPLLLEPANQSSCMVKFFWDWSNSSISNKVSDLKEMYRYRRPRYVEDVLDNYDTGFDLIVTKSKVRGRGKAFAMYFETSPNKDCRIVGWSLLVESNAFV